MMNNDTYQHVVQFDQPYNVSKPGLFLKMDLNYNVLVH